MRTVGLRTARDIAHGVTGYAANVTDPPIRFDLLKENGAVDLVGTDMNPPHGSFDLLKLMVLRVWSVRT